MAKLGIDLDGVCYDFPTAFRDYVLESCPDRSLPDPLLADTWDFFLDWGFSRSEFNELCKQGVDSRKIFREGRPYEDCVDVLQRLHANHTIHIITHRMIGEFSIHNTVDWLREWEIPFDALTFAEDKSVVKVDLLLDDYEVNWRSSWDNGVPCVVMDRPWNRHLEHATRVFGWEHFEERLPELLDSFAVPSYKG